VNLTLSVVFFILSGVLTKVFYILVQNTRLMDKPNDRSMHSKPTVRGGGIVFISLSLLSLPLLCYLMQTSFYQLWALALSLFMVASVSFLDDLFDLSVKPRFFIQCTAALLIAVFIQPQQLDFVFFSMNSPKFMIALIFFMALWAINHFNFMDGLDGLCASQAAYLLGAYSILFSINQAPFYQGFCLVLMSSLMGFLIFNFPPAKLFMGDVGSATLGLITFSIALTAQQQFQIPIIYWFMLNGLFLFDATSTLIRRIMKQEQWFAPHKKHAYQRLRQSGISIRRILLSQLLINSCFFILVFLVDQGIFYSSILIFFQMGIMILIYYLIEKIFPMFQSKLSS
jgi:UDP-N-acetylmuramyl pentapeptide phosphotransferase/UDP-N-acetylglucosamine-1-phosphate transferase